MKKTHKLKRTITVLVLLTLMVPQSWADDPNIWPLILIRQEENLTSGFGYRTDGFGGNQGFHPAVDIAAPKGTLVVSTITGTVIDHFPPPDGYWQGHPIFGGCILIVGDDGWATFYGHLSKSYVHEGEKITKGQMIGRVGDTGLSTGNHLHYSIMVDPARFLGTEFNNIHEETLE